MKIRNYGLAASLVLILTACGGGGGGTTSFTAPPPVVVVVPPVTCVAPQVLTNGVCTTPVVVVPPTPVVYHANSFSSNVVNQIMPVVSVISVATVGGNAFNPTGNFGRYMQFGFAGSAQGDMRGTGLDDIILTPSTAPMQTPFSKLEFWVNNGDGTFTNKADELIVGGSPALPFGPMYVKDMNGDGKLDIIHIDTIELGDCGSAFAKANNLCTGGKITYLESQANGTWTDKSANLPPTIEFDGEMNVVSSNGDGVQDILVSASGWHLYKNDGKGHFTDQTNRLPVEIRGTPNLPISDPNSRWNISQGVAQDGYIASFAKVAGQAKPILVTASYGVDWGTQATGTTPGSNGTKSVRFFTQQQDGSYVNAQRIILSPEIADNCGANIISVGDFSKTGTDDVLVVFEQIRGTNNLVCHPTLYRNIGTGGQINYVDVTDTAIPQWKLAFNTVSPFGNVVANGFRIIDADGDGNLDIAIISARIGSNALIQRVPFIYGDGKGNFTIKPIEIDNEVPSASRLTTLVGEPSSNWDSTIVPLRVKPNVYGFLLVEQRFGEETNTTPSTNKQLRLHTFFPNGK